MPETSPDPKGVRKLTEATDANPTLDSSSHPDLSSSGAAPDIESKHASDARIAGELLDAAPSLPAGRREAVVALLTGLMADRERLGDYQGCLKFMLEGTRLEGAEPPASLDVDGRDERIAREGFAWLPDGDLAAIAVSPKGLKDLYELLEEPGIETGAWLMDAMMAAHADRPEVLESEARTRGRIADLLRNDAPDL